MTELTLFDQPRLEAWERVRSELKGRKMEVLRAIEKGPCTIHELCQRLNVTPNQISGRLTELEKGGYIKRTGTRRVGRTVLSVYQALATSDLLNYD